MEDVELSPAAIAVSPLPLAELTPQQRAYESRERWLEKTLANAYHKTSSLHLTDAEHKKLTAEFPDNDITVLPYGDSPVLYIDHMAVRDRLTQALGAGQWTLIERYPTTEKRVDPNDPALNIYTIYSACVLIARGALVGEEVGSAEYYEASNRQSKDDCHQGAKSIALRRCAAKGSLGCGSQVWRESWTKKFFKKWEAVKVPAFPGSHKKNWILKERAKPQSVTTVTTAKTAKTAKTTPPKKEELYVVWVTLLKMDERINSKTKKAYWVFDYIDGDMVKGRFRTFLQSYHDDLEPLVGCKDATLKVECRQSQYGYELVNVLAITHGEESNANA